MLLTILKWIMLVVAALLAAALILVVLYFLYRLVLDLREVAALRRQVKRVLADRNSGPPCGR